MDEWMYGRLVELMTMAMAFAMAANTFSIQASNSTVTPSFTLENSFGFTLRISLGLRLYFTVHSSSRHNTDTVQW